MQNRVLFKKNCGDVRASFETGVSLHGHTRHSIESLAFLGDFLDRGNLVRGWVEFQRERGRRNTGISLDLRRAYWTPPLCERQAYDLEYRQIEDLGLRALVSLSDHDTIEACTLLREMPHSDGIPISTEWTVPFGKAVFHIGVHNLPAGRAQGIAAALLGASKGGTEATIREMFVDLSQMRDVLLVFNHPLWNFAGIPPEEFAQELSRFLHSTRDCIHALELNGMRSYRENVEVIRLAAEWDLVLISGGDRHGCEPNAILNLTNATEFAEFIDEIRNRKQSSVLVMPQYQESLGWRMYKSFSHVIGDYPGHPEERRSWDQRIFHPDLEGRMVPVRDLWHLGPPGFLKKIFALAVSGAAFPVWPALTKWGTQNWEMTEPACRRAVPEPEEHSLASFWEMESAAAAPVKVRQRR